MAERNDWQIKDQAPPPYAKCAVSGFTDGPFVDFGVRLQAINPNLLLNVDVAKDIGRFLGMVNPEDHREALERIEHLEAELDSVRDELAEADEYITAIDVLEKRKPKVGV